MSWTKESPCFECHPSCCERFVLNGWSVEQVEKLVETYPFLRPIERDVRLVNGRETMVTVFECDRLGDDGSCINYPDNRPSFCEGAGVRSRPKPDCKLFEMVVLRNPDRCE